MTNKSTVSGVMAAKEEHSIQKATIEPINKTTNADLIDAGYDYAHACLFCASADVDDMKHEDYSNYVKCKNFGVYVNSSGICKEFEEY